MAHGPVGPPVPAGMALLLNSYFDFKENRRDGQRNPLMDRSLEG